MRLSIVHITPDFNYACGRSYYVYLLLKYLRQSHNVHLITNGGDSLDRLDELKIPYTVIKSLHSRNLLSFTKNIRALRKFISEKNIDIIHTHHRFSEQLGLNAAKLTTAKLSGHPKPKTVFTSLSIVNRRYKVEYKSDKIIAVSGTIKKMLNEKFRVNENKISLIPNFTDTDEIGNKALRGESKFYNILAIGRFHPEKNFEILLKALKKLKSTDIKVTLVGEGESEKLYRKYIAQHKLNAEILPPQKNLAKFFSEADTCVLPSARDPFPNFMLQAGLHAKPFIGSNVDGIAELINDSTNGLLFSSRNENELAEKIMLFNKNKSLAKRCAINLHNEVMKDYTQTSVIPNIENLYTRLVNIKE